MVTLRLNKTSTGNKSTRYLYEIFEGEKLLCSRRSNRNYVACHVFKFQPCMEVAPTFAAPLFFGSTQRLQMSRGSVPYGIAYLATEKPAAL